VLRWLGILAAGARTQMDDERDGFSALEHARSVQRARRDTRQDEAATDTSIAALVKQA
jgi:hypothetical protein